MAELPKIEEALEGLDHLASYLNSDKFRGTCDRWVHPDDVLSRLEGVISALRIAKQEADDAREARNAQLARMAVAAAAADCFVVMGKGES